jgi:hypothetical protein
MQIATKVEITVHYSDVPAPNSQPLTTSSWKNPQNILQEVTFATRPYH